MTANDPLGRRDFLKQASMAGVGALAVSRGVGPLFALHGSPAEKLSVAVMGLNGRGMVHVKGF
ncbi:MAG TPA: twin-arginine translocation signal domain-containing protein, partial [Gemmatimonadaceae bacterium]|nr:twin-arginine translocation signal domain-containing protein [Gemmatimonadaceae bacterium]